MAKSTVIYIHHSTFRLCVCKSLKHVLSKMEIYYSHINNSVTPFPYTLSSNILHRPQHSDTKLSENIFKIAYTAEEQT